MEILTNYQKKKASIYRYQAKNREKHLEYMRQYMKNRTKIAKEEREQEKKDIIIQEYLKSLIKK
jgi:hypothetical protein